MRPPWGSTLSANSKAAKNSKGGRHTKKTPKQGVECQGWAVIKVGGGREGEVVRGEGGRSPGGRERVFTG